MRLKRQEQIAEYLCQRKFSTVQDLSEKFNISIATVRRDLDDLERKKIIKKEYGGIRFLEQEKKSSSTYNERIEIDQSTKVYIGKLASSYIKENDCIYIDSGSTAKYIVDFLDNIPLTIITNNLYVISKCIEMDNINLIVLGGNYYNDIHALASGTSLESIKNFNINKAFIATSGFTPESGFTNAFSIETGIKKYVCKNSQEVFVLLNEAKWGKIALMTFLRLEEKANIKILTNAKPPKYLDYLSKYETNIIY